MRKHQQREFFYGLDKVVFATIPTRHNAELRKDVIVALHFGVSHKSSINKGKCLITSQIDAQ